MDEKFKASWNSLRNHSTPRWFRDAKFGIYTHWGVYSVPACGPNGTWYPYNMYIEGTEQYKHHLKTYGGPAKFGYKDFIPQFKAEKFNPLEWADLFKRSGAKFAGPVAEHHDGFTMWDTKHSEWNAAKMGPKRDVVGDLEKAIRKQGMKFLVALHHFENWFFFPHWIKEFDVSDPKYAGLYGPLHNLDKAPGRKTFFDQEYPSKEFLDMWLAKSKEVVDKYRPEVVWFDFGLGRVQEHYKREFLAHYYNRGQEWGKEVAVTYKMHDLPPGTGVLDYELGRMDRLTYNEWITDTSVDQIGAWSYVEGAGFKSTTKLVHNLVENVSKNGYLLLNVGPKADGEIPVAAKKAMLGMGEWLAVNGEAIFDTVAWMTYGEGPTKMDTVGMFSERKDVDYTADDIRFTVKDDFLYAICLGWPKKEILIKAGKRLHEKEIQSVRMLGVDKELSWEYKAEGLSVRMPEKKPCDHACVLKIARKRPF